MLLIDIDGVLFSNIQRRHLIPAPDDMGHASNWSAFNSSCSDDTPINTMINLVKHLAPLHREKIFVTSRDEDSRGATLDQLEEHFFEFDYKVIMRPMDEHRPSTEYKRDVFAKLAPRFDNDTVLIEDNQSVVSMVKREFPQVNCLLVPSYDCSYIGCSTAMSNASGLKRATV